MLAPQRAQSARRENENRIMTTSSYLLVLLLGGGAKPRPLLVFLYAEMVTVTGGPKGPGLPKRST